jgi:hypothetical protein
MPLTKNKIDIICIPSPPVIKTTDVLKNELLIQSGNKNIKSEIKLVLK